MVCENILDGNREYRVCDREIIKKEERSVRGYVDRTSK
jgi:hypothetical protein